MNELGIYVHIPFCIKKCYYCDFISYANRDDKIEEYVNALIKEIKMQSNKLDNKDYITTIYIGGGTPSSINANFINQIIETIMKNYNVDKNAEITIEVNPGTVTEEKLQIYKRCGVNRISIGLQSTKNDLLKQIGRIHTYEDFLSCYSFARKVGFKNINVDLMLGLPNQKIEDLEESIRKVINLNPEHISLYSLILEENTPLEEMISKKTLKLPSDELERKMYWETKRILEENGYLHYEISNYAKNGFLSRHNTNCWKQKEYLGFGVAAHSYYKNKRYNNLNQIEKYCKNINEDRIEENRTIQEIQRDEEKQKEYMLLGLRMIEGVNIQDFKNKFVQNPIYLFHKELEKLVKEGLLEIDLNQIKLTSKGLDFANLVWEEFI